MVGVPIRCQCIAPVRQDRYQHHTVPVRVTVNGLLIADAEIEVIGYIEGGRYVQVEFSGTIAIFAPAILPAIQAARLPDIRFEGWVEGQARELKIDIAGKVVMMTPVAGQIFSLVGADR
ncbi:hypothetical protein [Magnetospirillum sulfuroxidans]|uniref:Uncharacterized protein n=1 Tax=Magnetospirillum sulfuroxidans TaxID=611300 RepID=A0ABS5IE41_9PROT|nr:hypothetical protein [Magnetospirillum sulfuroxidans]MBR9972684.1 hypothetical protein [Magnetospirillum sulfuroxidans]